MQTRPFRAMESSPQVGAPTPLVGGRYMHRRAAGCVRRDAVDRQAAQVKQTRGVRYQILLSMLSVRRL